MDATPGILYALIEAAEVARLRGALVDTVPAWARERVRRWQTLCQRYPEDER